MQLPENKENFLTCKKPSVMNHFVCCLPLFQIPFHDLGSLAAQLSCFTSSDIFTCLGVYQLQQIDIYFH